MITSITQKLQRGMSASGMMGLLVLIGFSATVLINIGPAYLDNKAVKEMLSGLKDDFAGRDIAEISDKAVRGKINKYFQVNMVSSEVEEAVEITRVQKDVFVSINYEIRKNLIGNVDIVVWFENEVNLTGE